MKYIELVRNSVNNGADERVLWRSVEVMSNILEDIKESHPEMYECYMKMLAEAIHGPHFTEETAKAQVAKMHHTDSDGQKHCGEYWTMDDVRSMKSGKNYPTGTTCADVYVAYNAAKHDFSQLFDDTQIVDIADALFFSDEDYLPEGKVWKYFQIN